MTHDPLCPPGLKLDDSSSCPWCCLIREAREDERKETPIANA